MSIKNKIALLAALLIVLCGGCSTAEDSVNTAVFSYNPTVGHTTKQQFISISTEGKWSISIEYTAPEGEGGWCTLSPTSGVGNANVLMFFGENTLDEERSLTLNIAFANEQQQLHFTQRSNSSQVDQNQMHGWLELPAFSEDRNRYYFSKHMLPSANNSKRSFSLLYDADIYHSLWVAYPLYRGIHGSGNRTNAWGIFDPNIPEEKQLYMSRSYYGSYDRGHMLPSASRAKTTSDNYQTFYPTNMSPQLGGLNQRKWAGIEGQVRNWSNGCDTLYVVTGAVFQTVDGNETVEYTKCSSDSSKDVAIPNYYYKALLMYKNKNNVKSYEAVGLWIPHKAAEGVATKSDAITIDRLEELTGLDFFPNLDDATEQAVEKTWTNSGVWNLQ